MKFALKLTALFSIIFVLGCASIIYFVNTLIFEILEDQMKGRLEDQTSHVMADMDRMFLERYGEIQTIAADPLISSKTSSPRQITDRLKEYMNLYKGYGFMSFYDLNRMRIADTMGVEIGKQHSLTEYWKDISDNNDFVMGISESEIVDKPVVYFASIVKDKGGTPLGVVVSRLPIERLDSLFKQAFDILDLRGYLKLNLVNKNGLVLYSNSNKKAMLREISPDWEYTKPSLAAGKKVGSGKLYRGKEEEIYVFGQEQGYRDFKGNGWTLIVHVSTKVALAPAFQFRDKIVIILSAVGIGALLMIFFFSKTVTEPLKKLSKASVEIGKGNLDVEVSIRSKDEIGQLAGSFNKMVDDLHEYRDRLTASHEELETKVSDRTSDLRNANERLQVQLTERRRAEEELRRLNRMLRTRSACNQALARATEEADLIFNVCKVIVESGGYRLSWVGFAEQDEKRRVRPVAQAGRENGYLRSLDVTWTDTEKGRGATGVAIRTGKPCIISDVLNDPACFPWREEALQRGYASVIGLPLTAENKPFGAMTIYAGKKDAFDDQEIKLLAELADALSYGIMVLRTRGERRRAEEALGQAKLELEDKVARRTAELSEANEKLEAWIKELEQRNREITTLSNLGDLLQACATPQEAYTVIAQSTKQLFPSDSGALFIFGESRNLLDAVAVWGDTPPDERLFSPDDCWALRRGRPYVVGDMQTGLLCGHVHRRDDIGAYLCVPMMAQGEALGVLHVLVGHPEVSEAWERLLEARQRLAPSVADHIALTVANLKLRETLRHLSIRDPLTGLFNRRYMEESLERELRRADRKGTSVGIIMIDIDHFKRINDTYGHEAGDTVLREMGVLLQRHIRGSDIACRYGGEEFTLILADSPLSVAQHRAEHLREEIKELHIEYRGQDVGTITLSMGVAAFPQHGATEQALLQSADLALYRAKAEGRDRVVVI